MSAATSPSGGGARPVQLFRVPASGDHAVLFLGPLLGSLEHFTKRGSVPCNGEGACDPATHRTPLQFYAYAPAEVWDASAAVWYRAVFQATAQLEELLRGRQLRGEVWSVRREKPGVKKSPLEASFIEVIEDSMVGPSFDMRPVLRRVFNTERFQLGAKNPNPPRLMAEPIRRPGPRVTGDGPPPEAPEPSPAERVRLWKQFYANGKDGKEKQS